MGKLLIVFFVGTAAILAGWANSYKDNVLLLLLTAWMGTLTVVHLQGIVRLSLFSRDSLEAMSQLATGLLNPMELFAVAFIMTVFSLIAYFTLTSHWFLLAHGGFWSFATLRQLAKL